MFWTLVIGISLLLIAAVVLYDLTQRHHAILRNFPIVGHFRYWLEAVGPELRQYIVTSNNEERPFSRDERRWIYASSKCENNYFGFGTDHDLERTPSFTIIRHSSFPIHDPHLGEPGFDPSYAVPCAKVLGEARGRRHAFRPASIINTSAMSFGSLSARAVESINRGCKLAGCMQNTGEGGVSRHHKHGGDLIWQIGTGYFGCRDAEGRFSMDRLVDVAAANPIRAIEIKLSQGAKPGVGGLLPAAKITHELAEIRGIEMGRDCISPSAHTAFDDVDSMLDFVETIADRTGLPVGIKSAVGQTAMWHELARLMSETDRGVDYIAVDGGEGGTGAAPLVFSDHVALPFRLGMSEVFSIFAEAQMQHRVVFVGAGRLGFPENALFAFALGCDMIAVAREAMLAVGCIQAQRCHTNHCPTGVATQSKWLMRGLDPTLKSARLANYIVTLRKEMLGVCRACGECHPALITGEHFEILDDHLGARSLEEVFGYQAGWSAPDEATRMAVREVMQDAAAASTPAEAIPFQG